MAAPGMLSLHHSAAFLPLTKHLTVQHSPLPSLSRASGISGMSINDGWRGEVSSGKHAASQKSERPPLLHSLPAHSRFCLLKLFVRGTKRDMGVRSAIELYNPELSSFSFFHRIIFKPLSAQAQSMEGSSPSAPTCPIHSV